MFACNEDELGAEVAAFKGGDSRVARTPLLASAYYVTEAQRLKNEYRSYHIFNLCNNGIYIQDPIYTAIPTPCTTQLMSKNSKMLCIHQKT